jgi:CheY-like chemotaxis protein
MGPVLKEQLAALKIDPATVKQAIITHAHPDHVMAVPMFRELASVFLARTGRVQTASSGAEALERLRGEPVDLVVADLHMPDLDGAELCQQVKRDAELARIPVVLLLRSGNDEDRLRAVRAGADDMLAKPLGREQLIGVTRHFLETGLTRGLPRVDVQTPVRLRTALVQSWGTARNISRGGMLVDTDCEFLPKTELELDFMLPASSRTMKPIAQVVWSRESDDLRITSHGLRFLQVDASTMRELDDFIVHHAPSSLAGVEATMGDAT